jgi:hypothetical protein
MHHVRRTRSSYKVLVSRSEGKSPKRTWEILDIRTLFIGIECEGMAWVHTAQNRNLQAP